MRRGQQLDGLLQSPVASALRSNANQNDCYPTAPRHIDGADSRLQRINGRHCGRSSASRILGAPRNLRPTGVNRHAAQDHDAVGGGSSLPVAVDFEPRQVRCNVSGVPALRPSVPPFVFQPAIREPGSLRNRFDRVCLWVFDTDASSQWLIEATTCHTG